MLTKMQSIVPRTSLGKHLSWRVLADGTLIAAFVNEKKARQFLDLMQEDNEDSQEWLVYFEGPRNKGY
jgi:hypothetical protein